MSPDHPGAGVPHDIPDTYLHIRSVAMHLAVGASCLVCMKGTSVETLVCVIKEFPAVCTELSI